MNHDEEQLKSKSDAKSGADYERVTQIVTEDDIASEVHPTRSSMIVNDNRIVNDDSVDEGNLKQTTKEENSDSSATSTLQTAEKAAETTGSRFHDKIANIRKSLSARRASAEAALALEAAASKEAKAENCNPASLVEKEMSKLEEADLEAIRPSQISVTVVKGTNESYGFALVQDVTSKQPCVMIETLVEDGILRDSPLKVGDVLLTVNNKKVADCEKVVEQLISMNGPVTIVVETRLGQRNPCVVQAFCRKPSKETMIGIGFHVLEHGKHKLLQINHLDAQGLLSQSALSQGDLVLAINGIPCAEKSPQEAAALILESDSTVNIIVLNPRLANSQNNTTRAQSWMRSAKRAGIAIGGGAMVGVGLIFIPTLPPPFGEVLIVGGVSVLGTEFEAPKRLVRSTRDSLERAVGRNDAPAEDGDCNAAIEINEVAAVQSISDTVTGDAIQVNEDAIAASVTSTFADPATGKSPPKRTMLDRLKRFGRNYVLPFLDQVVGDRKQEDQENPTETIDDLVDRSPSANTTTEEANQVGSEQYFLAPPYSN